MPVYRIQMPDGSVARVQADTSDDALTHATSMIQAPGASQAKARSPEDQSDYLRELQKRRAQESNNPSQTGGALGKLNSFAAGVVGPISGEIIGGLRGAGNAAANLYRGATGKPQVSSRAIYEAARDADDEAVRRETDANPVSAGTGSVLGLLSAGGELAKGFGLLKGLPSVVKAATAAKALPGVTKSGAAIDAAKALAKANLNPGVLKYGGAVGKATGVGALGGGALGLANGSDWDERLANAEEGAKGGAIAGGFLEGVAAPLARPFVGAGKDIVTGLVKKLRPAAVEGAISDADRIAARKAVGEIARQAGVTSDNLAGRVAPFEGLDQTVAEGLGSSGQNTLGGVARRAGTTGDNLRTQVRARTISQPQAILSDFKSKLGVDPEAAAGNVEAMVKAGQENAAPQFKAYYDATAGGVQDAEVERLLATPMGQKLMKGIETRAKNLGRPAEALTFGRVEVPEAAAGVHPMDAPPVGETSATPPPVPRGPAEPPPRGPDLIQFMRNNGGVSNDGGEMAAMGLPGIGKFSKFTPQQVEGMIERAHEAGYFPEHLQAGVRPTEQEFFDKVGAAARGEPVYARQPDPAAQARYEARAQAEADQAQYDQRFVEPPVGRDEHMAQAQGDEPPAPGYGGAAAPKYEPAYQASPTGEALDRVRRRANAAVERLPSGAPVRTGPKGVKNEERATFAEDFSKALAGTPGAPSGAPGADLLRGALDTSSDYLGVGKAFRDFQGQLTRGTTSSFAKTWKALKPGAEQDAARGALAHDVIDLWGRGQLKGGKFGVPGIKQKLEMAFGKKGAEAFVAQMERRAELAASGARMAPFSGSPTMSLQEASAATNDMAPVAGSLARIGGKLAKGKPLGAASEAIGAAANYAKTAGSSVGFRNELGRILSLPSNDPEFVALLKEVEAMTPEQQADLLSIIEKGRLGSSWPQRAGVGGAVLSDQTRHD